MSCMDLLKSSKKFTYLEKQFYLIIEKITNSSLKEKEIKFVFKIKLCFRFREWLLYLGNIVPWILKKDRAWSLDFEKLYKTYIIL